MTAEKEALTEEERLEARRLARERLAKTLSAHPGIILPTRDIRDAVFDPVEIRGEPLSETIIKMRRC